MDTSVQYQALLNGRAIAGVRKPVLLQNNVYFAPDSVEAGAGVLTPTSRRRLYP